MSTVEWTDDDDPTPEEVRKVARMLERLAGSDEEKGGDWMQAAMRRGFALGLLRIADSMEAAE